MKKQISVGLAAVLTVMIAGTAACGVYVVCENQFDQEKAQYMAYEKEYQKLGEVQQVVKDYFVGDYDPDQALEGAVDGYIQGLGDRWSYYLTKDEYAEYKVESAGELVGIGVSASYDSDTESLYIVDVYDDSPAEKAGMAPGDRITAVEGKSVSEAGYTQSVQAVRGEEGTSVQLTVEHSNGKTKKMTITRKKTSATIVRGRMLKNDVGYLKISSFDQTSDTQFDAELKKLVDQGAKALVFDVRNNPGGSAVCVANMLDTLLPEGKIITLESKDGKDSFTLKSDAKEVDLPMAVLVNGNSYSAAEFFAADLQEYGKAVVVGEKTCGKGYAQTPLELSDGSALVLSNKKYYTSQHKNLAGVGITPDKTVSLSEDKLSRFYMLTDAEDDQLQAAVESVLK